MGRIQVGRFSRGVLYSTVCHGALPWLRCITFRYGRYTVLLYFSVILEVISFYQVNENEVEENKVEDKVKGQGKKRKKDKGKGKGKGKDKSKLAQNVDEKREVKRKEQEQDVQIIKAIRGVVSNKYIAIGDHGRLETTVSIYYQLLFP